jgi:hypothetical protein
MRVAVTPGSRLTEPVHARVGWEKRLGAKPQHGSARVELSEIRVLDAAEVAVEWLPSCDWGIASQECMRH